MTMIKSLYVSLRRAFQLLLSFRGPVPDHVAFVMDGNRRYAERQHVDKATGHTHGYGKMVDVIHWCIEVGVKYITVYAFSIDNFKRSADEVGALMRLAEEKYIELAQDHGLAEREGIQMRIVGDLDLPPPSVQGAAARLMRGTAVLRSRRATLNVCFSYTASEESVTAIHELQEAIRAGLLQPDDVTPEALTCALRTGPTCPPVDLLIRTSGETRLSDFLLWQASHAHLCYLRTLWPDLSYWDFAQCIMSYQRHARTLRALRHRAEARLMASGSSKEDKSQHVHRHYQPSHSCEGECGRTEGKEMGMGAGCAPAAGEKAEPASAVGSSRSSSFRQRRGAPLASYVHGLGSGSGAAVAMDTDGIANVGPSDPTVPECLRPSSAVAANLYDDSNSSGGNSCSYNEVNSRRSSEQRRAGRLQPFSWLWEVLHRLGKMVGGLGCNEVHGGHDGAGSAAEESSKEAVAGEGGRTAGREVRLLHFYERLEQARLAWIAAHVNL